MKSLLNSYPQFLQFLDCDKSLVEIWKWFGEQLGFAGTKAINITDELIALAKENDEKLFDLLKKKYSRFGFFNLINFFNLNSSPNLNIQQQNNTLSTCDVFKYSYFSEESKGKKS